MTTTPLTEAERAQLRTLCDTALPGPWETHYDEGTGEVSIQVTEDHPIPGSWIEVATTAQWPDDMENSPTAEFIAAARTAIPALLDRIEELEELEDAILRVFGTDSCVPIPPRLKGPVMSEIPGLVTGLDLSATLEVLNGWFAGMQVALVNGGMFNGNTINIGTL